MRFALNQKTVKTLPFEACLDLAAGLGMVGIEARNDLGRPFFDGIAPVAAGRMVRDRGLRLLGLSEVYPFNHWTPDREAAIRDLIETAATAGAETVSLIPSVEPARPVLPLAEAIGRVLPLLDGTEVVALVEPIGFSTSSVPRKAEAVAVLAALGAGDRVKIVHDTFQHRLAGEVALFPAETAMVHISGISDPDAVFDDDLDKHRVLVDAEDRVGNLDQIRAFLDGGYQGVFSFECTAPDIISRTDPEDAIGRSMAFLQAGTAGFHA